MPRASNPSSPRRILVDVSPWEFGWEALVALSTLALAAATVLLAWLTSKVARASGEDIRAQWRPLLIGGDPHQLSRDDGRALHVPIRNAGRGPAIFVRTTLDPGGVSPENWSLGSIAAGEHALLVFSSPPSLPNLMQVLLDYTDLSGRLYSSAIVIDDITTRPRFYDLQVYEDSPVTHHGQPVRPQPGLRNVAPPKAPSIRDRGRAAVSAFRSPR